MAEGAHSGRRRGRVRAAPAPLLPPAPPVPSRSPRDLLLRTTIGRVFLAATAVKLLIVLIERFRAVGPAVSAVSTLAGLVIVVTAFVFIVRGIMSVRRQLLWPVRRKLIVSYLFIGVVPALLLLVFFLFAGQIVFTDVTAYLFKDGYEDRLLRIEQLAIANANDIAREPERAKQILENRLSTVSRTLPGVSFAIVPKVATSPIGFMAAGPWSHLAPPASVPLHLRLNTEPFRTTIVCQPGEESHLLILRAMVTPAQLDARFAAIVDLPIGPAMIDLLREETQIRATGFSAAEIDITPANAPPDAPRQTLKPPPCKPSAPAVVDADNRAGMPFRYDRSLVNFDYVDWDTGRHGTVWVGLRVRLRDLYWEVSQDRTMNFGGDTIEWGVLMLLALGALAVLFLIIEIAALVMGLALARSITAAVHGLFVGTERVRLGDFTHRIKIETRDQLGQLSDSFNQMSSSIEHLLQQAAEKRRLEEELRIAREIQMSLLPSGSLEMPGVRMTALCVPAREVGGDYYDFFRLGPRQLGLLIADVSGKGTSAALYMAELKGLMLALSMIHESPRTLLIEVNRILSDHLDTRSFITMTYAVIDLETNTMTFARAGHTPLIYLPAAVKGTERRSQVLTPDGMVLGLRVPNIERLFPEHLIEHSVPLAPGDVIALYTDGISEAMNAAGDLFGEARLAHLIEEHGHFEVPVLRERILREVEAFVAGEDQHDDMTMILMKIEEPGAHLPPVHTEGVVEV